MEKKKKKNKKKTEKEKEKERKREREKNWQGLPHHLISASSLNLPRPPTLLVGMNDDE